MATVHNMHMTKAQLGKLVEGGSVRFTSDRLFTPTRARIPVALEVVNQKINDAIQGRKPFTLNLDKHVVNGGDIKSFFKNIGHKLKDFGHTVKAGFQKEMPVIKRMVAPVLKDGLTALGTAAVTAMGQPELAAGVPIASGIISHALVGQGLKKKFPGEVMNKSNRGVRGRRSRIVGGSMLPI